MVGYADPFKIVRGGRVVAFFRGWQAVLDVKARAAERRERLKELRELAAKNDDKTFWKRYTEYLEWDRIESPDRAALHKMTARIAEFYCGRAKLTLAEAKSTNCCRICGEHDSGIGGFTYNFGKEHSHTYCLDRMEQERVQ